ncbi:hypothetical protein FRC15_007181 [Serendipita sp. 397]|nr:hypothetical protein FRC15_007181 [Serendipita sp. 397]
MTVVKLPIEIWKEILEWLYVDGEIPSRDHALVSRDWKQMLLSLPTLWRKVEINLASRDPLQVIQDRLERRLHHAKEATLDVSLITTWLNIRSEGSCHIDLLKKLARLGPVERWHSLSISGYQRYSGVPLDEVFVGSFMSIQALSIHGFDYSSTVPGPHSGLFNAVVRSKPRLKHLGLDVNCVPFEIQPLLRLQSITTIFGTIASLKTLSYDAFPNLCKITINSSDGVPNDQQVSHNPLPATVTIRKFRPEVARNMEAHNISTLFIDQYYGWEGFGTSLELPNLHTLRIRPCAPQLLQVFKAPKVQVLDLSKVDKQTADLSRGQLEKIRQKNKTSTSSLFQEDRHLLTIYPTSLVIHFEEITDSVLVIMLEAWPQLKHLTVVLSENSYCFGMVSKHLLDATSPLCPRLENLMMEVWWHRNGQNWQGWRVMAKKMMNSRLNGPLESIVWKNSWFEVDSIIRGLCC